jgi:hypothetical protein
VAVEDPWKVSEEEFPTSGQAGEKLLFLSNNAVFAPSGHNTQPWLFKVSGAAVELDADRTRGLPVVDPEDRALVTSCGVALYFLRVAIRHFAYTDEVRTFPNPDDPDLLYGPEVRPAPRRHVDEVSVQ